MQTNGKASVTKVLIDAEMAGQRVDNFLFRHLKGVPKSRVYRMLREGEVRISGHRTKPDYKLAEGDEVRIPPVRVAEKAELPSPSAIDRPLLDRVIYRDDALLVIDKPSGQAVHGGSGISLGVIEQLRQELPQARFLELAHRLDKETSGVLVLALKRSALTELHRMLREGETHKTYFALAAGHWRDAVRNVKLPLRKYLNAEGERRVAVEEGGQSAHTIFRLVSRHGKPSFPRKRESSQTEGLDARVRRYDVSTKLAEEFSLLEAELKTGRTHQIRVHLAALKHPIAGDDKYGDPELNRQLKKLGFRRMFLHAARMQLAHPLTGQALILESPLPDDLRSFLEQLGT